MPFSTYLANKLLDHTLGTAEYTKPAAVYVSLHTADPGLNGANEISGGSYVRQPAAFDSADGKHAQNTSQISFEGMPEQIDSPITHGAVWDQASGGNFLYGGSLTSQKVVNAGDTFIIPAGDLDITYDA